MAAVIRHTLAEGRLLLRQRLLVSLVLAAALAVPICVAGLTLCVSRWLGPVVQQAQEQATVAVLLHPRMNEQQRRQWVSEHAAANPEWRIEVVSSEEVIKRLTHWFPYLQDLFERDAANMVPPMLEITTDDPDSVETLRSSPAVIAVGPSSSLQRRMGVVARRLELLLGAVAVVLLLAAALLAGVWVHLELYRHADEITIMRLVGATEATVQGPFYLVVAVPGALAGGIAAFGTATLARAASKVVMALGLPPLTVPGWVPVLQIGLACLLPVAAAAITLRRHMRQELEA